MFAACRLDTFGVINRLAKYKSNQSRLALLWLKDIAETQIVYKVIDKIKYAQDIKTAYKKQKSLYMGYKDDSIVTEQSIQITPQNAAELYRQAMGITNQKIDKKQNS